MPAPTCHTRYFFVIPAKAGIHMGRIQRHGPRIESGVTGAGAWTLDQVRVTGAGGRGRDNPWHARRIQSDQKKYQGHGARMVFVGGLYVRSSAIAQRGVCALHPQLDGTALFAVVV